MSQPKCSLFAVIVHYLRNMKYLYNQNNSKLMRTITPTVRSFLNKRYDIKIFHLLIIFFTWSNTMFAQQRSEAEAMAIAEQFLSSKGNSPSSQLKMVSRSAIDRQIRHHAHAKNPPAASAFYIVNDEASNRFVVVSSDVRLHEVLGYSEKGIIIPDSMPCGMVAMLESYNREYAYVLEHGITEKAQRVPRKIKAVSPLIKTDWGQGIEQVNGNYYWLFNIECPETEKGPCATGCVATAMAQIMNYHKYPSRGQGTKKYTSANGDLSFNLSINFADKAFDWNNMLNTYKKGITSQAQIDAVTYLMKACGYSVNMNYGFGASGALTQNVPYALINYFKYNPNTVYYQKDYYTAEEWEEIIQTELNANRPILYSAIDPDYVNQDGSKGTGHAFILDGCNSNGYYHFNWGWNGSYDNYFLLSSLNPDDLKFSAGHDMVCRISPQTVGSHEDIFYTDKFEIEGWETDFTIGQSTQVKIPGITICYAADANTYDTQFSGYIAYLVSDLNNNPIDYDGIRVKLNNSIGFKNQILGNLSFSSDLFKEGSAYMIFPVAINSSGYPTPIRTLGGKTDFYVAMVSNGKVKLYLKGEDTTSYPDPEFISVVCKNNNPLQLTKNDNLKLTATFKNNGVGGNVETVPVIMAKDKQSIVKWGDIKENYFEASQNITIDYSISLNDVPEGDYYGTVLLSNNNDGWLYNNNCLVDIRVVPNVIPVNKITLNQTSASLTAGGTLQLTATVLPENATDKTVNWKSNNTSVATVDSNGKVTAVASGTATITCTANDGSGVTATCRVLVTDTKPNPDPYFISVVCQNSNPLQLTKNEKLRLTATFGNDGGAGNVRTVPVIMAKDKDLTLVMAGDIIENYFAASQNTTINYSLPLTDVPEGDYYTTVLFYLDSDNEEEKGWYYNENCLVDIRIKSSDISGDIIGDVNGDGDVNGTDGVVLVNIILGRSENRPAADVNGDGEVNGTDYVALVNIILGRSYAPSKYPVANEATFAGTSNLWIEPFTINAGEEKTMTIDLWNPDDDITLVQYDLRLPEGLSLKMIGDEYDAEIAGRTDRESHSLSAHTIDGTTRFLLASHNNFSFTGTDGAIIKMTLVADENYQGGAISLENILLVTPREQETRPGDLTLGIRGIFVNQKTDEPVYNVAGQKLYAPRKGINIINGKKIIVK